MLIHFLHMNDVHSQLESYMRLGNQLRQLRSRLLADGDIVFTFDIGDVLDRVRPETEATMGLLNADLMAALEIDGWVFGNNEGLTIPVADWPLLVERANTHVFGSNLRDGTGRPFDYFVDSITYAIHGVTIGVFGVTPAYALPYHMLHVHPDDPFGRARDIVGEMKASGVDLIVCLSHLGLRDDGILAERVPDIDLILGGHTHQFMPKAERVGKTYIFQPGKHARVFGHTTVEIGHSNEVLGVRSRPVPVRYETSFDPAMERVYDHHRSDVEAVLGRQVASLSSRLTVAYEHESSFANLLADVLYDEFPGDLSIMMTGALNASLLPGDVSLEALLGACPTPTRPIVVGLTGSELLATFEQSVQPETYERMGVGFGFRGGKIGYLTVSGASIEFIEGEDGRRHIKHVVIGGEMLDDSRIYRVITCEYLWLSPVFASFRNARNIDYQPPLVREVLLARLGESGRIHRAMSPRYIRVTDDREMT